MTRRDLIYKWFVYAMGLLPVWLFDAYVLPRYPIFGVAPMLLPLAVVAVAVLEGAHAGASFGMAVGLLWELAYPGGNGFLVILMALLGLGCGWAAQYVLSQSLATCLLCSFCTLVVIDGLRVAGGLLQNTASLPQLLGVAVPECLLSLAWTPVIYLIFRLVFRRVGGAKLA